MSHYASKHKKAPSLITIACITIVSIIVVITTLLFALWNNGILLPSWISWNTRTDKIDLTQDNKLETVKISNRRLVISDDDANRSTSPHDWLVSDIQYGDLIDDESLEILALIWIRDNETATYSLPGLESFTGYSQRLCLMHYNAGQFELVWFSQALQINVEAISLSNTGEIALLLADGNLTNWEWTGNGLQLFDNEYPLTQGISTLIL